jgi:hypothetical protein
MLSKWRYSGFHFFCDNRISPDDETAMDNLARHITREPFFSQERAQYLGQGGAIYAAENSKGLPCPGLTGRHVF